MGVMSKRRQQLIADANAAYRMADVKMAHPTGARMIIERAAIQPADTDQRVAKKSTEQSFAGGGERIAAVHPVDGEPVQHRKAERLTLFTQPVKIDADRSEWPDGDDS